MINISTQLPAVWTPQAAQTPAAVAAVAPIRPVQEGGRNGQSGAGADPETQASRQGRRRPESESAPILPRRSGQEEDSTGALRSTSTAQAERLSQADAEQRAEQEAAQQAAEAARREQLQSVLTNVWKASAAVVDRVLGRDDAAAGGASPVSGAAGGAADRAPGRSQPAEQLSLPWPVQPQERVIPAAMNDGRVPVAYDERGNSSLAPLEPGALISRRV
jgi:hypothetical protein